MTDTSDVAAFMIQLHVAETPALFLALSADGAVNRSGSGRPNPAEKDVFIGQAPGPFYEQVAELLQPSWLDQSMVYTADQQLGDPCVLTMTFFMSDRPAESSFVLEFRYGADSLGPPPEVREFVHRAVAVTQEWYLEQLAQVAALQATNSQKPWWKFW